MHLPLLRAVLFCTPLLAAGFQAPEADAPADAPVLEALACPAGPDSALPNLARGADGKVRLSWIDREGEDLGILRFAVLEEAGWSAPREIVRGTDLFINWADFPSIAALESGVLMAHWLRDSDADYSYDAEFAVSSDGGATWSEPRKLHDHTGGGEHGFVSIVPMDTERFGAIWLDGRDTVGREPGAGDFALYFRSIDATGALTDEDRLDERVCSCCQTSLVVDSSGGMLATVRDRSSAEIRDIGQFTYSPFHSEGWGLPPGARPVHADGWRIEGCPVNGPRAALSPAGGVATAWFTGVGEDGGDVRLAFQERPEPYGAPIKIDGGSAVGRVDVLWLDEQSVLVTWLEDIGDAQAEWRAVRVERDGRMGQPLVIATVPHDRSTGFLRMAPDGEDLILAWTAAGETRTDSRRVVTARLRAR